MLSYQVAISFILANLLILLNVNCTQLGSNGEKNDHQLEQTAKDHYHEDLFIKPLIDGKLFAQFQFETVYRKDIKSLRWENKIEIFPLSLADLISTVDLNELHFSLTRGNWNYRNWGYSTRPAPPGAQIRVKFSKHNENPERSWNRLVNSLAGKFCASLVAADKKTMVSTKLAFENQLQSLLPNSTEQVFYANLPEETLCTENLTPWKKLLPCYTNSGLASLLNAVNLLKSSYSSLAVDIEPRACTNGFGQVDQDCEQVQLTQTFSVVFNPLHLFEGRQTWSLAKIFGNSIQRKCPLASHSLIHVDITQLDDKDKIYPQSYTEHQLEIKHIYSRSVEKVTYARFDVNSALDSNNNKSSSTSSTGNIKPFNLGIKQSQLFKQPPVSSRPNIPVYLRTHIAGVGAADGTLVATVTNNHDEQIRVTYMDIVPHFLRVYLHTLTIRTKSGQELKPDKLNFVLSKETSSTLIEFSIIIPPSSEVQISYDFERAFLRWTDYKPDANKGVLLGSTMIRIFQNSGFNHLVVPTKSLSVNASSLLDVDSNDTEGDVFRVYARPLLIILPTPDFSMPYNVICLVCTVLMAAFSPLHSMTTRKPVIKIDKSATSAASTTKEDESEETKKDQ